MVSWKTVLIGGGLHGVEMFETNMANAIAVKDTPVPPPTRVVPKTSVPAVAPKTQGELLSIHKPSFLDRSYRCSHRESCRVGCVNGGMVWGYANPVFKNTRYLCLMGIS